MYAPNLDSIRTHKMPDWFRDAKLGIFIHWGLYSVPAFAKPTWELGAVPEGEDWNVNNPYSEWYLNTLRLGQMYGEGETVKFHNKTYGKDFPYEGFVDMWKAEKWSPNAWAELFKKAGAKYVVPVSKHHDGYCLWDSKHTSYNTAQSGPCRDIIKELAAAVREKDMRLGMYYSGILDWRFSQMPIGKGWDMYWVENRTYEYADYAYKQFMELVDLFKPEILWNDIGWPEKGMSDLPMLFAYYYNNVPDGIVNDRWNGLWQDYTLREYQIGESDYTDVWENTRGIGLSFGYNTQENESHMLTHHQLISLLLDTVAKNGNLLINIGPRADGTIQEEQESRLLAMGKWLETYGDGIYSTRPYERRHEKADNGVDVYFTQKGREVFVFLDNLPAGDSTIIVKGLSKAADKARVMDAKLPLKFAASGADLAVTLTGIEEDAYPIGFRM